MVPMWPMERTCPFITTNRLLQTAAGNCWPCLWEGCKTRKPVSYTHLDVYKRQTYDRSKIEAGIIHSCHKRPVSPQQINSMIDEIENQIFNMEEKEVPTSAIGELVMGKLKDLDEVAYVRFASVYREFKDMNTFIDEIGKLLKK